MERHSIKRYYIYIYIVTWNNFSAGVAPVQIQDVTAKLREFTDKVSPETGALLAIPFSSGCDGPCFTPLVQV